MKLSEATSDEFLKVTENNDFTLYKHQEEAVEKIRKNRNVIVSVPTASGKTLIGYISIYDTYLR